MVDQSDNRKDALGATGNGERQRLATESETRTTTKSQSRGQDTHDQQRASDLLPKVTLPKGGSGIHAE